MYVVQGSRDCEMNINKKISGKLLIEKDEVRDEAGGLVVGRCPAGCVVWKGRKFLIGGFTTQKMANFSCIAFITSLLLFLPSSFSSASLCPPCVQAIVKHFCLILSLLG